MISPFILSVQLKHTLFVINLIYLKKTNQCTSISVSGKNEIQIEIIQVEWEFSLFKNNNTFSGTRKK